jgi:hypothetical protein
MSQYIQSHPNYIFTCYFNGIIKTGYFRVECLNHSEEGIAKGYRKAPKKCIHICVAPTAALLQSLLLSDLLLGKVARLHATSTIFWESISLYVVQRISAQL